MQMPTSYLSEKIDLIASEADWLIGLEGRVDPHHPRIGWILQNAQAIVTEIEEWRQETAT